MQIYKTLIVEKDGPIFRITFNRSEKKNAINQQMIDEIICALDEAAKSDSLFTVLTGKGDYYSSGRDLAQVQIGDQSVDDFVKKVMDVTKHISAYIDHPKPLIALVNGPAIGVAVTVLGLFDLVYASNKATFTTPFTKLGIVAEGASTYTFPLIMGFSKASEVLMFGKTLTAEEAFQRNLVTQVFPDKYFKAETHEILKRISQLPPQSLLMSRDLIRGRHRTEIHEAKNAECKALANRFTSEERMNAMANFLQRKKSKL